MHHVHLVQQSDDGLNVGFVCSPNHSFLLYFRQNYEKRRKYQQKCPKKKIVLRLKDAESVTYQ
jgi:hypothetical protein